MPETKDSAGNGNGRRPGGNGNRRDENGLTEKQRLSIPIIAAARTRHQGVKECVARKILGTVDYFYKAWMKEDAYVDTLMAERTRLQGESKERSDRILAAWEEEIILACVKKAVSSRADAMRAAEVCLALRGYDTGRGARVNVSTTVMQQIAGKQNKFKERLERQVSSRLRPRTASKN